MPVIDQKDVLKDFTVAEAMRRLVIDLATEAPLEQAIRFAIKYKVNAILITGADQEALGVVTKTDLMGAYYAGLPLDTPAASIMVGPPLFCRLDDSLDAALDPMRTHNIHRLYVRETPGRPWASWPIRTSWACSTAIAVVRKESCSRKTGGSRGTSWPTGSASGSDDPGGLCPKADTACSR